MGTSKPSYPFLWKKVAETNDKQTVGLVVLVLVVEVVVVVVLEVVAGVLILLVVTVVLVVAFVVIGLGVCGRGGIVHCGSDDSDGNGNVVVVVAV